MGLFSFSGDKDKEKKDEKAERKENMNRIRARVTGKKPEKPSTPPKQEPSKDRSDSLFDDEPSFESKDPVDGPSKDDLDLDIEPQEQEQKPESPDRNAPDTASKKVPDAPETKDIDVPEIDKGPLFIRVEKFKQVRRMVKQLRQTGEDMKTKMAGLQTTLKEDRDAESNLEQTMQELDASIEQMKDMLSP